MLFMEPEETRYDLRWQMLGIHVRVHPMFWLVSVLFGLGVVRLGVHYLFIWIGCLFVSILIHELGHVCMGQIFGTRGHIVLYGFGGLAVGSSALDKRWQRILVFFAGPLAGFLFIGVLFLGLWAADREVFPYYFALAKLQLGLPIEGIWIDAAAQDRLPGPIALFTLAQLFFINLIWGLVNLLPVWPLDGGQISRDVWEGMAPVHGRAHSLGLSMVVAGLLSIHCFLVELGRQLVPIPVGSLYAGILFAVLAFQSFQLMQMARAEEHWRDDHWDGGRY